MSPAEFETICAIAERSFPSLTFIPVDEFYQPSDLELFAETVAWWPRFRPHPKEHAQPTLYDIATARGHREGESPTTFEAALNARVEAFKSWMLANDRTVPPMDETEEQKKYRLLADAQRRFRNKAATDTSGLTAEQVHRRYLAMCDERDRSARNYAAKCDALLAQYEELLALQTL